MPGSEDLSGEDEVGETPPRHGPMNVKDKLRTGPRPKLKRPRILKRRGSRSCQVSGKDWGERCVDVFEFIAQIGEGMRYFIFCRIRRRYQIFCKNEM